MFFEQRPTRAQIQQTNGRTLCAPTVSKRGRSVINGILCVNKPEGITSFGVVGRVRRIAGQKKCGHTGTLDPMATGVLPVLLGAATRFADFLPMHDKAYRATVQLGLTTDTLDITGQVLTRCPVTATTADFARVLAGFVGEIEQLPPMYSAVSVDGQRLYELARKGLTVERNARQVQIYSAELLSAREETGSYDIAVHCSAGTYIRTLAADIGAVLGCGAALTALERSMANGLNLEQSRTLEQLEEAARAGDLPKHLIPLEQLLEPYPALRVSDPQSVRFLNGGALDLDRLRGFTRDGLHRVYAPEGRFLGLGQPQEGELKVRRIYQPQ